MDDPFFRVTWKAGQIIVHAKDNKQAIDVAMEYIRQPATSRITVEPQLKSEAITK